MTKVFYNQHNIIKLCTNSETKGGGGTEVHPPSKFAFYSKWNGLAKELPASPPLLKALVVALLHTPPTKKHMLLG